MTATAPIRFRAEPFVPTFDPAWPYSPKQLTRIAQLLGRSENDRLVRFVVGIACSFLQQADRGKPSASQAREKADAAASAAKALSKLNRIPREALLAALRVPVGEGPPFQNGALIPRNARAGSRSFTETDVAVSMLGYMLRSGAINLAATRLQEFADSHAKERSKRKGASRSGRKSSTEHVVVAIAELIWVWDKARPGKRGRDKFLDCALEPLRYDTTKRAFKSHLEQALPLVRS